MRLYIIICFALLPLCSIAQKAKLDDGRILHNDTTYAMYKMLGTKIPTMPIVGQSDYDPLPSNPETNGEDFKDIVISMPNGQEAIYCRARVLASPQYFFLKYYYNIKVLPYDAEINIATHPYFLDKLSKLLVKYDVFKDGAFQYAAMEKMLQELQRSNHYIAKQTINDGSYRTYNTTPYDVPDNTVKIVRVSDDKIFMNDVQIGSYTRNNTMQRYGSYRNEHSYYILGPQGTGVAQLRVPTLRASFYMETLPDKKYYEIYSAERVEEKIIADAARVLVAAGSLKQP